MASPRGSHLGLRYRVYTLAVAGASLVRLTLPDATDDPRWWGPSLLAAVGAILLAWRGSLVGWVLTATSLLWTLLFGEDQLTQSAFLLACSTSAIACFAGPTTTRHDRLNHVLPRTVAALTVTTYGLAAFHKLNRDFFLAETGCAAGGLRVLAENWSMGWLATEPVLQAAPGLFLGAEVALVMLFLWRPPLALPLAFAVHIPLTIVFAPSFAFMMMSGWVCLFTEEELLHYGAVLRHRWLVILAVGLGAGALSFTLYLRDHWVVYPWWQVKEAVLWCGLVLSVLALPELPGRRDPLGRPPVVVWGATLLFATHGLAPYTGLKMHHSGAMLSNLRIDRGCWNHLLVPEGARLVDPYLVVVSAVADAPGAPQLEARLEETLWNPQSLARAAERYCSQGARSIEAVVTRGAEERFTELCQDPFPFGEPWLPDTRTHQENLPRACPHACIH